MEGQRSLRNLETFLSLWTARRCGGFYAFWRNHGNATTSKWRRSFFFQSSAVISSIVFQLSTPVEVIRVFWFSSLPFNLPWLSFYLLFFIFSELGDIKGTITLNPNLRKKSKYGRLEYRESIKPKSRLDWSWFTPTNSKLLLLFILHS